MVPEKIASGAIVDDAEELAKYERLARGKNGFMDFVKPLRRSLQQKSRPARRPSETYIGERLLAVCAASLIALSHLRVLDGFFDISDSAAGRSLGLLQLALRL